MKAETLSAYDLARASGGYLTPPDLARDLAGYQPSAEECDRLMNVRLVDATVKQIAVASKCPHMRHVRAMKPVIVRTTY
jgi:hypothetical protein